MFFIFHIDEFLNDWTIMKIMEVIVSLLTMIISVWGIQAVRKENKIWLIVYICTGGLLDLFVIALFLRQLIGGDNVYPGYNSKYVYWLNYNLTVFVFFCISILFDLLVVIISIIYAFRFIKYIG